MHATGSRMLALAFLGALATSACTRHEGPAPRNRTDVPVQATLEPWEPVDPSFTGCAGG